MRSAWNTTRIRGHQYALQDQLDTERIVVKEQPAACANCHAAEVPQLIEKMGWEAFNHTPYNDIKSELHTGTSCADCHDPDTMELRITRPAFVNAMAKRGVDVTKASRQEMRSYVCEQCHVEYYFAGDNKVLTFPWEKGMTIDDIDAYYTEIGFTDWKHKETGGGMLKAQHPETELYSTGLHAASGVACADCHMPYVREGSVKVSDHWLRSPLVNISGALPDLSQLHGRRADGAREHGSDTARLNCCARVKKPCWRRSMPSWRSRMRAPQRKNWRESTRCIVRRNCAGTLSRRRTAPASTARRKQRVCWPIRSTWRGRRRSLRLSC